MKSRASDLTQSNRLDFRPYGPDQAPSNNKFKKESGANYHGFLSKVSP